MSSRRAKTFCRLCISSCGLVVDVEDQQVTRVLGDRDHPITRGYSCSKGRALPLVHHHPRRLERPQMRVDGVLADTSWEEAFADLGVKLGRIVEESGPSAVGLFLGGGGYQDAAAMIAIGNLQRALKTRSFYSDLTVDAVAKIWVSDLMCGVPGQSPQPDWDRCRLTLLIGSNPVVSHGHTFIWNVPAERMRQLNANGGETWVIDPRQTETARKATRHLAPRPGSDYAILAFLIRELLQQGADWDYLEKHAQDVDALSAAVAPYTLEKAAALSGLPPGDLDALLASVRRSGRMAVETGTGVTMGRQGNVVAWLSWALMIVTGSMDRAGGVWFNPGMLNAIDQRDLPPPMADGGLGPGPPSRPELRSRRGEYPCTAMADEIEAGHLRAVLNFSGNMVACLPDTRRTVAALKSLEVFVSMDIIGNATTDISTHVLPPKGQLERADLSVAQDAGYPCRAGQYTAAVVDPVGDRRSFWWIISQIANGMGLEVIRGVDPATADDDEVLANIARNAPVDFATLRERRYFQTDDQPVIGWLQAHVDRKLGGWRLAPQLIVDQLATLVEPAPLVLIPHRRKKHVNGRLTELDAKVILIGEQEAARAGLASGDKAVVRTVNGSMAGIVEVDASLMSGVMIVPHGWDDAFNVNQLTGTRDVDPLTGMPFFSGLEASIRPAWQLNTPAPAE